MDLDGQGWDIISFQVLKFNEVKLECASNEIMKLQLR